MAAVNRTTVWVDNQVLTASALNGEFNNLLNALAIANADISGSAAIDVTKISGTAVNLTSAQTLTNKRITKRISAVADATSIDVNSDNFDMVTQVNTQGSGTLTINNPTGTPTEGQGLIYRIKSTSSQTYAFGNQFKGGTTALPTTHAGSSKFDYLGFIRNTTSNMWDLVAIGQAVG